MASRKKSTPARVAAEIRALLRRPGCAEHADRIPSFFKEKTKSHGWYTGDLRRLAGQYRRAIQKQFGVNFLVRVADQLFSGRVGEEKILGILLLEKLTAKFEDPHFALFESWLDRVTSWADHDGLVHYLIAPMIVLKADRAKKVFEWARSPNRWHGRAACVALIQGTRQRKFFLQIVTLSNILLRDQDEMVQKGLGWLLRETAKADGKRTMPYLTKIRERAPRLVLRTACETLTQSNKNRILSKR
jgi:3-methyladenine DNA glycosylase AlkD